MLNVIRNIYYSFPVQLFILHFRKFQVLLLFWYILFDTVGSQFMRNYGANALFLAPEYLGNVNAAGAAITGVATGVFFMSWNITTFILHSKRYRFLAATSRPFVKYCINNSLLPIIFLIFYFVCAFEFETQNELMPVSQFFIVAAGFMGGFFLLIAFSFAYFFNADKRIVRTTKPRAKDAYKSAVITSPRADILKSNYGFKVGRYLGSGMRWKKAREVVHYGEDFLNMVFKRHHFAAVISIFLVFIGMIFIGFFLDHKIFQIPAAASIIILFSLMMAVIGALAYFLENWSFLFMLLIFLTLDVLYRYDIIDLRNKAYGLNYINKEERPAYNPESIAQLYAPEKVAADKANMISILNNWKSKQAEEKPVMIFLNFSGGGVRSASFAMNVLQQLDSITHGALLKKTFLMSGASGGMLAATYFRELYRNKEDGASINIANSKYADNISGDLLNPVFSSMIARDLLSPAQKFSVGNFTYIKDRGYAFEQKLNQNTEGILDKHLSDYSADEKAAKIPLMIFNSVITRDGRKMMLSTQPLSFLMRPEFVNSDSSNESPDAIDFAAMFSKQEPLNIRLLTALRMNATFPYVLPNVWLPTNPVIDVMDAGIRDNFGQETTLRFAYIFKDWIKENTSGVMLIQIRDRNRGSWDKPFESNSITGIFTKPGTILQNNWYKFQDYSQSDQIAYAENFLDSNFHRISFMYIPERPDKGATLNFHLTASEKKDVIASLKRPNNRKAFAEVKKFLH